MDCQASDGGEGVSHCFPYRGMGVHREQHVIDGGLELQGGYGLGQNFRRQRSDHVHAQYFAGRVVRHYFDETIVMVEYGGLAIGQERKLAGLHRIAGVARLFLGEPDRADLRLAISGVGNAAPFERRHLLSSYFPDRDDAFHGCRVRQLGHSRDDISDRIDLRFGGFHVSSDVHEAALELGARFFQANVLSQWRSSHRKEHMLGREVLRLAGLVAKNDRGTAGGSISRMVTSEPKDRKMEANSTPTAPAPTTTRVLGICGSFRMSRLPTITLPSKSTPGRERASEPVAKRICVASTSAVFPAFSTCTWCGAAQRPQPCRTSTLFLRKRNSMPLACLLTMRSLRASMAGQLILKSEISMPNSSACFRVS